MDRRIEGRPRPSSAPERSGFRPPRDSRRARMQPLHRTSPRHSRSNRARFCLSGRESIASDRPMRRSWSGSDLPKAWSSSSTGRGCSLDVLARPRSTVWQALCAMPKSHARASHGRTRASGSPGVAIRRLQRVLCFLGRAKRAQTVRVNALRIRDEEVFRYVACGRVALRQPAPGFCQRDGRLQTSSTKRNPCFFRPSAASPERGRGSSSFLGNDRADEVGGGPGHGHESGST